VGKKAKYYNPAEKSKIVLWIIKGELTAAHGVDLPLASGRSAQLFGAGMIAECVKGSLSR
jgi:hypothetical protein